MDYRCDAHYTRVDQMGTETAGPRAARGGKEAKILRTAKDELHFYISQGQYLFHQEGWSLKKQTPKEHT